MNLIVKKKWLEALRGGEYKKGRGQLRVANQFCCLGVLCDLYSIEFNLPWKHPNGKHGISYFLESSGALPDEVIKWAQLKVEIPRIKSRSLASYNDRDDLSFEKIADLIEKHL